MSEMATSNPAIDFTKLDGLVPGIVQDAATGQVLMVGFLNEESYRKTLESGFVTFWSRTRRKLWMKGETSGNRLRIRMLPRIATMTRFSSASSLKAMDWFATKEPSAALPSQLRCPLPPQLAKESETTA